MSEQQITLDVVLTPQQANDLAQLCKRQTFSDFSGCAVNEDEAYRMRDAQGRVYEALRRHGFNPR